MEIVVSRSTFSPKELDAITGLAPVAQRDWRRHGYLPTREDGWSQFTLDDVAAIALRKAAADVSLGPAFADRIFTHSSARQILEAIIWWAFEAHDQTWSVIGDDSGAWRLRDDLRHRAEHNRFHLIDEITGHALGGAARLLILYPAIGHLELTSETSPPGEMPPAKVSFTFYLDLLGRQIAANAGKPLATISPGPTRSG